jgi:inner membrane protein
MTAPNHIAGSFVFTGIMCSFWNINIFASISSVVAIATFSILPDIDNPRAIIGRCVYPLALLLNRQFGHRTLTHSLLFVFSTVILASFLVKICHGNEHLHIIIFFSLSSHLILDMLTLHGVPLLYPFRRNTCVMPGNPDFRLRTGNIKTEGIVFVIFILTGIILLPLFTQGFWTSYNREFGTIDHCDRENHRTSCWVICEYSFVKDNNTVIGEGYIINSDKTKLVIFNGREVFSLSTDDRTLLIHYARPRRSSFMKTSRNICFIDVSVDSINRVFLNRICSGVLQSNINFHYRTQGLTMHTNYLAIANDFNFHVYADADTSRERLHEKLVLVCARIKKDSLQQMEPHHWYHKTIQRQEKLKQIIAALPAKDLYHKDKYLEELLDWKDKTKYFELKPYTPDVVMEAEKQLILSQLEQQKPILLSGQVNYLDFSVPDTHYKTSTR